MSKKQIIVMELKSNQGTDFEFVSLRVTVRREKSGCEPVFHMRVNVRGYSLRDRRKGQNSIGRIYLPKFDAIVRISDFKVLNYKFFAHMKSYFKRCRREKWMAMQSVNAIDFDSLTGWMPVRVSRRKISTHWDRLLEAWNELNPKNKLAYFDPPKECRGELEYLCMGRFLENGETVEFGEDFDYSFHVLSHVTDFCPESTREIYIQYKDRERGGFAVSVDVETFRPLRWRFGKAAHGGKISAEHYAKIKKFLCECDHGYYFKRLFYELETFGRFDARRHYDQYHRMRL